MPKKKKNSSMDRDTFFNVPKVYVVDKEEDSQAKLNVIPILISETPSDIKNQHRVKLDQEEATFFGKQKKITANIPFHPLLKFSKTDQANPVETDKIELEIKERQLREQQLGEYYKILKQLEKKRNEFHISYPQDIEDDITKAYGAACQLVNILNGYAEQYKNQDITLIQFKAHSSRVIQSRRNGVLGEHRGFKELLTNLLLVIGTLGIGYIIAAFFTQSLTPIKCNTKTVNLLNDIKLTLEDVGESNSLSF